MTAIIKKENLKNKPLKEYNSLKNFINSNSTEEEIIISLLEHSAENLRNSEVSSYNQKNKKIYDNYLTEKELKQEQDKSLCNFLLHKVLFF